MTFATWAILLGMLLTTVILAGSSLRQFPVMLHLAVGYALCPVGWAVMAPDLLIYPAMLERVTEIASLISRFVAVAGAATMRVAVFADMGVNLHVDFNVLR